MINLTYKISKLPETTCDALVLICLIGIEVDKCLTLSVKTGKTHLLKLINTHFRTKPNFENIVVKIAKNRFSELRLKREKFDIQIDEAKIKRLVSPIIMVLVSKPEMIEEVLSEYFDICNEGARYFENKLEKLLPQIVKSRDQVERLFKFLLAKFKLDSQSTRVMNLLKRLANVAKQHTHYYRTFLECLQDFFKKDAISFNILRQSFDTQVLFDFIILFYENDLSYFSENLKDSFLTWKIKIEEFFKFTAFTEKQHRSFELCSKFCNDLIAWNIDTLNIRSIYQYLYGEFRSKEFKEFPVMLSHIALIFAKIDKEWGNSVEFYLDVFREGINSNQCSNLAFWNCLIGYCSLDRIIAEETIRHLLPEVKQKEFIKAIKL